jgi:hypothetical protein
MVGELLEHVRALARLALGQFGRDGDRLRRLARGIFKGPLEREIDEAADLVAAADRDLARDQR